MDLMQIRHRLLMMQTKSETLNDYLANPANWEQGTINGTNGQNGNSTVRLRTIGFFPLKPNTEYTLNIIKDSSVTGNPRIGLTEYSTNVIGQPLKDSGWKYLSTMPVTITTQNTTNFGRLVLSPDSSESGKTMTPDKIGTSYLVTINETV